MCNRIDLADQAGRATCIGYNEYALAVVATTVLAIGFVCWIAVLVLIVLAFAEVAVPVVRTAGGSQLIMVWGTISDVRVVATATYQQMVEHYGQGQVVHQFVHEITKFLKTRTLHYTNGVPPCILLQRGGHVGVGAIIGKPCRLGKVSL